MLVCFLMRVYDYPFETNYFLGRGRGVEVGGGGSGRFKSLKFIFITY